MALEPLAGLKVVDLFAGSGALGIEALSRGAERADFVESDRVARATLAANLEALDLGERARVWAIALPTGLTRIAATVAAADLILLDPPYGGRIAVATLEALGAGGLTRPGARVVVEHHAKDALPEEAGGLRRTRARSYGETVVSTYVAHAIDEPPAAGA